MESSEVLLPEVRRKSGVKRYNTPGVRREGGVTKGKLIEMELRRAIELDNYRQFKAGLEAVMDKFSKGEQWAIEFVRDSLDGKPKQRDGTNDGPSVIINIDSSDARVL